MTIADQIVRRLIVRRVVPSRIETRSENWNARRRVTWFWNRKSHTRRPIGNNGCQWRNLYFRDALAEEADAVFPVWIAFHLRVHRLPHLILEQTRDLNKRGLDGNQGDPCYPEITVYLQLVFRYFAFFLFSKFVVLIYHKRNDCYLNFLRQLAFNLYWLIINWMGGKKILWDFIFLSYSVEKKLEEIFCMYIYREFLYFFSIFIPSIRFIFWKNIRSA